MTKKPSTLKSDLAHLPIALTPLMALHHWVCWRWELKKSNWTKPPYTATGQRAKNNDPTTWATYEAALAAVQNGGKFDGIGFCLCDAPFDCVDLDHCLDPATGEPDPWAKEWIDAANGAYVERTPSGEGLRIIAGMGGAEKLHRKWPIKGARDKAAIEIYRNAERYITITGLQVGDCKELGSANGLLERIREQMEGAGNHSGKRGGTRFDFNNAGSKIDYDDVIQNGAPDGVDVSALFHSVVGHLHNKGMTLDEIVEELGKWPNGIGQRYAGRLQQEVKRSFEKWTAKVRIAPDAGEPDEKLEWDGLDRRRRPLKTRTNTRRALLAMEIKCSYDTFHDKYIISNRDSSSKDLKIIALEVSKKLSLAYGFEPSVSMVEEALLQISHANTFNPIADYLAGLKWDGKSRLDHWLVDYLGAEDTELVRAFGRLALIAAVRRVRHPGTKFDPIIVLEGEMGKEKSKAIETMAGIENFSDQTILGKSDREQQELLAGVWLYEIADLTNIRRTEVEHIKAFASRTHDRARPAYGHSRIDRPRTCVLFATTNDDEYLKVADRRFWPVRTSTINIEALRQDRDQLWAEAAQQEREGASIVLDRNLWGKARIEQQAREEGDPWDDVLSEVVGTVEQDEERVESSDLLGTVLGIHESKQRDIDYKRLSRCMRRLGWDGPKKMRLGGKLKRGYARSVRSAGGTT
jgi:hypothetical protein